MKAPHRLRVEHPAEAFRPLLEAARRAGVRVGWLEFSEPAPPEGLAAAAVAGAARAVAVGRTGSVAVKRRRGPAVMADLVREHFLGCRAVLVRGGGPELPRLEPSGGGWRIVGPSGRVVSWSTGELLSRFGRPRHGPGVGEPADE